MKQLGQEIGPQPFIPDIPGLTCRSRMGRSPQRRRTGAGTRAGETFGKWEGKGQKPESKRSQRSTTGITIVWEIDEIPDGEKIAGTDVLRGTGWL